MSFVGTPRLLGANLHLLSPSELRFLSFDSNSIQPDDIANDLLDATFQLAGCSTLQLLLIYIMWGQQEG